jgi:hypothetical protein
VNGKGTAADPDTSMVMKAHDAQYTNKADEFLSEQTVIVDGVQIQSKDD